MFIKVLVYYSSCTSMNCLVHATPETPSPGADSWQGESTGMTSEPSTDHQASAEMLKGERRGRDERKKKIELRGEVGVQDDCKVSTPRDMKK